MNRNPAGESNEVSAADIAQLAALLAIKQAVLSLENAMQMAGPFVQRLHTARPPACNNLFVIAKGAHNKIMLECRKAGFVGPVPQKPDASNLQKEPEPENANGLQEQPAPATL